MPKQEYTLMKKGLDQYFVELRKRGITVDAPFVDDDYTWYGYWNDATVEKTVGGAVATACVVENSGLKGQKAAGQCSYYLFSMIRHVTCYNNDGPAGPALGREFYKKFNRINAVRPALTCICAFDTYTIV
jgi:hypothetical protein